MNIARIDAKRKRLQLNPPPPISEDQARVLRAIFGLEKAPLLQQAA